MGVGSFLKNFVAQAKAEQTGQAVQGGKTADQVAAERGLVIPNGTRDGWIWRLDAGGNLYRYNIPAKSKSVTASVSRSLNSTVGVVAKIPAVQTAAKIAGGAALVAATGALGIAVAGAVGAAGGAAAVDKAKDVLDDAKDAKKAVEDTAKAIDLPPQLKPNIAMRRPPAADIVDNLFKPADAAVQPPLARPPSTDQAPTNVLPQGSVGATPAGTPREMDFLEQIFAGLAKILNLG